MRSDERQHFALMWLPGGGALDKDLRGGGRALGGQLRRAEQAERAAKKITSFHGGTLPDNQKFVRISRRRLYLRCLAIPAPDCARACIRLPPCPDHPDLIPA